MALVMMALMRCPRSTWRTAKLLACNDLAEIMRHKLPRKIETDVDLAAPIEDRHRRCQVTKDFAYDV
jgi:hypothetical protein